MTQKKDTFLSTWNKELLQNIILHVPHFIFWKDKNSVYMGCNENYANLVNLNSPQEIIGKTDYDLGWHSDGNSADFFRQKDHDILQGKSIVNLEQYLSTTNGHRILVLLNKIPLIDEQGEIFGILGVSTDITELREAEIREKNALLEIEKSKKQKEITEKQVELFKQISASVAHELRTPLRGIHAGVDFFEEYMPKLLNIARLANQNNSLPKNELIPDRMLKRLEEASGYIKQEIDASFLFINMMLANIRGEKFDGGPGVNCKIEDIVTDALNRYPFNDIQKQNVHIDMSNSFIFNGSHTLLVHIFFNLLKNALYYLAAAGKGEISIWCEKKKTTNELHFKDTGAGIAKEILPHIFDQFFSNTLNGTGVGLTYCKMVMKSFGGDIVCQSIEGEYTEFILSFPKVSESTKSL
ncbi:MAG: PAS domain-containing sensor histidine kinase [Proteobacteria bacterium]|nr:PAS domain-containing sensor histidine kinase [Pseudomonadota bacterium]